MTCVTCSYMTPKSSRTVARKRLGALHHGYGLHARREFLRRTTSLHAPKVGTLPRSRRKQAMSLQPLVAFVLDSPELLPENRTFPFGRLPGARLHSLPARPAYSDRVLG
jgi:hypothetical protein